MMEHYIMEELEPRNRSYCCPVGISPCKHIEDPADARHIEYGTEEWYPSQKIDGNRQESTVIKTIIF